MNQCGAKTRAGTPCQRAPMENGRCNLHGGKSLKGIAHPNFQGKGYSRYIPGPLAPAFQRALDDPELLALNVDIATVESLIDDQMHRITDGDPMALFGKLKQFWASLWLATQREDKSGVARLRGRISDLLEDGAEQFAAVEMLLDLTEQKRKLVDTEGKRREKMQEFVRAEEMAVVFRALALAVKKHEKDPETLAAIGDEFDRVLALNNPAGITTD